MTLLEANVVVFVIVVNIVVGALVVLIDHIRYSCGQ